MRYTLAIILCGSMITVSANGVGGQESAVSGVAQQDDDDQSGGVLMVEFERRTERLNATSQAALDDVVATLLVNPELGVIVGSGTPKGGDADRVLSHANAVRDYLLGPQSGSDRTVDGGRIVVRDDLAPCREFKATRRARMVPLLTFRLRDGERGQREAIASYKRYYCWLQHDL